MHAVIVQSQQELDQCLDIRREVFIIEQNVPKDLEVDEWDQLGSRSHVLVYDDSNTPVATARLKPYKDNIVKIQRVAVHRKARGKGYGVFIMKALEDLACEQRYRNIILDAQCHAEAFYVKLGYKTVGEKFLEANIEHVRMEKALVY